MGAQLNIKSDDAYRLASRLARLTGKSLTAVVTEALRDQLAREEHERDRTARLARIKALAQELKAHMTPPFSSSDPDEFYDQDGLPR